MPHLSPQTLTTDEQRALLRATSEHVRDHLIFSLALGTGLRLGELVGLNVGDVYFPNGEPRCRIRIRAEIAKGGRVGEVFLPEALLPKLTRSTTIAVNTGTAKQRLQSHELGRVIKWRASLRSETNGRPRQTLAVI